MSAASIASPIAGSSARLSTSERITAGFLSLAAITLLSIAAWLVPSGTGMGTHTQLGIPTCSWPVTLGMPCPSCGMTTSFALAADGRFIDSARAQPFGFALAVGAAGFAVASALGALTGSRILGAVTGSVGGKFWWWMGAFALLAWGYKILVFRGLIS